MIRIYKGIRCKKFGCSIEGTHLGTFLGTQHTCAENQGTLCEEGRPFSTPPVPHIPCGMGKKDKQAQAPDAAAPKEPGKSGKKRRAESEAAAHNGDDAQAAAPKVRVSL